MDFIDEIKVDFSMATTSCASHPEEHECIGIPLRVSGFFPLVSAVAAAMNNRLPAQKYWHKWFLLICALKAWDVITVEIADIPKSHDQIMRPFAPEKNGVGTKETT